MESVKDDSAVIHCMQKMMKLSEQQLNVQTIKQPYLGPNSLLEAYFTDLNNEVSSMLLMRAPEVKPARGKKKKEAPRHDAIPEENEDGDDIFTIDPPPSATNEDTTHRVEPQDTTVSSTTHRPRRAAVDAAAEKIKRMTEMSCTRKLRRPSDFNQNDHGNYNVYNQTTFNNQTISKVEECFPRNKRRKGSGNSIVTSSMFFSSTMIQHSSPIQKGADACKTLEMSIIPPHTEAIVEEQNTTRTRTRVLRQKKSEEEALINIKEEIIEDNEKNRDCRNGKENKPDNVQHQSTTDISTDEDTTLKSNVGGQKKATRKRKDKTKEVVSVELDGGSSPSDSESSRRTRTRTMKKPTSRVEDLPVVEPVRPSPLKTIGEKIREKVDLFENVGVEQNELSSEGRVTRTKTRKMNKSSEDDKNKPQPEIFKVPLAVKNIKDIKKPTAKKPTEKPKEIPVVDPKQAAIDERKRLREERAQKAAAARDQAEKEKRENALKMEREREEKLKSKRVRDEKLKEELERKRLMTQAKIEQQKREQEAARVARLQEIMEEENRKEAQRKKEQEIQERKAQQAKLHEKLKASKPAAAQKKDVAPTPVEERNYSISEDPVPSDEDEESQPKRPIPSWAKASERNIVLADQIYLAPVMTLFFENPADLNPSVIDIFGAENVRQRPRTSSAVWNHTMTSE